MEFFILSDDIEIDIIKKQMEFIKSIFGNKLKLVTSLFIDEESKNKYYVNTQLTNHGRLAQTREDFLITDCTDRLR